MSHRIRSTLIAILLAGLLVACAAPATAVPTFEPTPVPIVVTAIPDIPVNQITIPTGEGDGTIKATITGNGDIAVMIHKHRMDTDTRSYWTPLVDSLSANEKLRIVTYTLRRYETALKDGRLVLDYLRAEGITRIICISGGIGQVCTDLQQEPELIGMVKFPGDNLTPVEADFPKLFVAADSDPNGFALSLQQAYDDSTEPKTFKSYATTAEGPAIFAKPDVGPQVLADITDFINGIVSGQ